MLFKKILLFWVLISLITLTNGQPSKKVYPDADAVYLSLAKTFVLNKDGSIITTVEKRQKLLTHRAFQSLYGETRITYNPLFQKITIQKAFTENVRHEKIETPQNGYNDILPGFSSIPKAYSPLREMVVTHTGLEQGAIINCLYEVKTEAAKIPWLMGDEMLQTECPVEKLTILVKVPTGTPLFFKSFNSKVLPKIEKGKDFDSYSWQYNEIPQRNRELHASAFGDQSRLLFSTDVNQTTTLKWLTDQGAFRAPIGEEIKKYADLQLPVAGNALQKALKIQEIVVKELNTSTIPASLLAFRVRSPAQVWQSNSGTPVEKCSLLSALLKAEGLGSSVGFILPEAYKENGMPFLLIAEPVVLLNTATEGDILLSADHLNVGNFELCNDRQYVLSVTSEAKKFPLTSGPNKMDITGTITLGLDDKLDFKLDGNFTGRFHPFFELLRNNGAISNLLQGFSGKAANVTASQSELKFSSDKGITVESRGKIKFLELPESDFGISSLHLNPLPFKRDSELDLGSPFTESYHYTVLLPEGYHLANPVAYDSPKNDLGNITIRIQQQNRTVEVTKVMEIRKPVLGKEQYVDFREMVAKWYTPKYKHLILVTD